MLRAIPILPVVGAAASAFGQVQTSVVGVHWSLAWQEARVGPSGTFRDGALGNTSGGTVGYLDPGEAAFFTIKMAMNAPPGPGPGTAVAAGDGTGTPLTWDPSITTGSSGAGSLSGLWNGDLNLTGTGFNGGAGSWSDGTTNFASALRRKLIGFTDGGGVGTPTGTGNGLTDIRPAQLGANAATLNHANNVNVFQGLWIPGPGYAPGTSVNFKVGQGSLGLLATIAAIDNGHSTLNGGATDMPIPLRVGSTFDPGVFVQFTPPSPSSLVPLFLGGVMATRRRRSSPLQTGQ